MNLSPVDRYMNWHFDVLDDLNRIRFLHLDWVWCWDMTVGELCN